MNANDMTINELLDAATQYNREQEEEQQRKEQAQKALESEIINDMLVYLRNDLLPPSLHQRVVRWSFTRNSQLNTYNGVWMLDLESEGYAPITITINAYLDTGKNIWIYRVATPMVFCVNTCRGHVNEFFDESLEPSDDNPRVYVTLEGDSSYGYTINSKDLSHALIHALARAQELGNNKQEELDWAMRCLPTRDRDD